MVSSNPSEIDWVNQLCDQTANDITFHGVPDVLAAKAVLASHKINVILLDLGPTPTGADDKAAAMIDEFSRHAPVIAITDTTETGLEQTFIDHGSVDVLQRQELTPSSLRRSLRYAIARRTADRHLAQLQLLDPVTGLAAQPLFWEILSLAIRRAKRNRDFFAVMLVDFKSRDVGEAKSDAPSDHLVNALTSHLQQVMRASDTIARFDSRQFAILAESMPRIEDVQIVAAKIVSELSTLTDDCGEKPLHIAIGIALFPTSATSAEGLISRASEAVQLVITHGHSDFAFA